MTAHQRNIRRVWNDDVINNYAIVSDGPHIACVARVACRRPRIKTALLCSRFHSQFLRARRLEFGCRRWTGPKDSPLALDTFLPSFLSSFFSSSSPLLKVCSGTLLVDRSINHDFPYSFHPFSGAYSTNRVCDRLRWDNRPDRGTLPMPCLLDLLLCR